MIFARIHLGFQTNFSHRAPEGFPPSGPFRLEPRAQSPAVPHREDTVSTTGGYVSRVPFYPGFLLPMRATPRHPRRGRLARRGPGLAGTPCRCAHRGAPRSPAGGPAPPGSPHLRGRGEGVRRWQEGEREKIPAEQFLTSGFSLDVGCKIVL